MGHTALGSLVPLSEAEHAPPTKRATPCEWQASLNAESAALAHGFEVAVLFVNDNCSAEVSH